MDKTGRVRFRYDGTPTRREESFDPRGIVTDYMNQIIVTDINNKCLHILDHNGQFLRCVDDCGLDSPYELSVDSEGDYGWDHQEIIKVLDRTFKLCTFSYKAILHIIPTFN